MGQVAIANFGDTATQLFQVYRNWGTAAAYNWKTAEINEVSAGIHEK